MVEGDKWIVYLPSELAYGADGSPPKIPGDSVLIFEMEMIKIEGKKKAKLNLDWFHLFRTGKRDSYHKNEHASSVNRAVKEGDLKDLDEHYAKIDGYDKDGKKLKAETRRLRAVGAGLR
jgi:hypothetical protein